jgi:AraC family transcriptional regulator, regulatory protein of adaptative response / methylated-DNA-[protein]-cysteine methyltransferase
MKQSIGIPSDIIMHTAVTTRDARYDEVFVFGVVTTGIFCKPSCPSRAANPENIRFFRDTAAAMLAGFRACKRCQATSLNDKLEKLVAVARYIEANAGEKLTLRTLSITAGLSESRLQRIFSKTFGVSPKAYQDQCRLQQFKTSLKSGNSVTDAIYQSGFGSSSRIYGEAMRNIGMTPGAYRAGGAGENIAYAHRTTTLGTLLMAATDRGVCFAQFGLNAEELITELTNEFPKATLAPSLADNGLAPQKLAPQKFALDNWINAIEQYLHAAAPLPEVPLDLRGTAFQIKVWKFLLSSNEGDVYSYGELAQGIDKPKATRAAASACGANKIAVLIPCHRVLRGDGSIGGYRWGIERKRALLDLERARSRGKAASLSSKPGQ